MACLRCGICCRLFLINLSKEEYLSGNYSTVFKEYGLADDFNKTKKYGGNILKQKKDGSCIYLKDNMCSIHSYRPKVCRSFCCDTKLSKYQNMVKVISVYKTKLG